MNYVDGFVLPVPKKNIKQYQKMAKLASKVWMDHGALQYCEAVAEDINTAHCISFPDIAKPKKGETVVFAWITFKSRAHRDKVNAKVMKDPRLSNMMDMKKMPFDCKRMAYGGFEVIVKA